MGDNNFQIDSKSVGLKKNVAKDFLSFLSKGNIVDLAIGSVLGTALTSIVNTLSQDVLIPLIESTVNISMSKDFYVWKNGITKTSYSSIEDAEADSAIIIKYGKVLEKSVTFILQAFSIYLVIRAYKANKR